MGKDKRLRRENIGDDVNRRAYPIQCEIGVAVDGTYALIVSIGNLGTEEEASALADRLYKPFQLALAEFFDADPANFTEIIVPESRH